MVLAEPIPLPPTRPTLPPYGPTVPTYGFPSNPNPPPPCPYLHAKSSLVTSFETSKGSFEKWHNSGRSVGLGAEMLRQVVSSGAGQSLMDRLTAARHTLAGSALARSVCKATTEELAPPKKKHVDCMQQNLVYSPLISSSTPFSSLPASFMING